MAAPMIDIHLKNVLELALKTINSNPDRYLKDIFGNYEAEPLSSVYGRRTLDQIATWLKTTKIPIILGFDLIDAQVPAITVHLQSSTPAVPVIGDSSIGSEEIVYAPDRQVLVEAFTPKSAVFVNDGAGILFTLPDSMPFESKELFFSGLLIRDSQGREYALSQNDEGDLVILQYRSEAPLNQMDYTRLELVSPVEQARYTQASMVYQETATIAVHGHSSRQEGHWLFQITMWALLKFRPLLTATYGLDLAMPSASDYTRDESYQGSAVWRRFITLTATSVWSWEVAREADILGLLLQVNVDRAGK